MVETLLRLFSLWKRVARRIGDVQARLLLLLFYYGVLPPFALVVKLLDDPLRFKHRYLSQWCPKAQTRVSLWESARRQF